MILRDLDRTYWGELIPVSEELQRLYGEDCYEYVHGKEAVKRNFMLRRTPHQNEVDRYLEIIETDEAEVVRGTLGYSQLYSDMLLRFNAAPESLTTFVNFLKENPTYSLKKAEDANWIDYFTFPEEYWKGKIFTESRAIDLEAFYTLTSGTGLGGMAPAKSDSDFSMKKYPVYMGMVLHTISRFPQAFRKNHIRRMNSNIKRLVSRMLENCDVDSTPTLSWTILITDYVSKSTTDKFSYQPQVEKMIRDYCLRGISFDDAARYYRVGVVDGAMIEHGIKYSIDPEIIASSLVD